MENGVLLCEHHHVIVHRQGWHIQFDARGHPEFIRFLAVSSGFGDQVGVIPAWWVDEGVMVSLGP